MIEIAVVVLVRLRVDDDRTIDTRIDHAFQQVFRRRRRIRPVRPVLVVRKASVITTREAVEMRIDDERRIRRPRSHAEGERSASRQDFPSSGHGAPGKGRRGQFQRDRIRSGVARRVNACNVALLSGLIPKSSEARVSMASVTSSFDAQTKVIRSASLASASTRISYTNSGSAQSNNPDSAVETTARKRARCGVLVGRSANSAGKTHRNSAWKPARSRPLTRSTRTPVITIA